MSPLIRYKGFIVQSIPLPFDSYTFDAQSTVWRENDEENKIDFISLGICYDIEEAQQLGIAHAKQWIDAQDNP